MWFECSSSNSVSQKRQRFASEWERGRIYYGDCHRKFTKDLAKLFENDGKLFEEMRFGQWISRVESPFPVPKMTFGGPRHEGETFDGPSSIAFDPRACRSESWRCSHAPATPALVANQHPRPTGEWQSCVGECEG